MQKPILNISELEYTPFPGPMPEHVKAKFEGSRIAWVAPKIGGKKLGYSVAVVPPGKRAFPFHSHRVNEEMFFVLEGEGQVRIGSEAYPIKQGDFMAHPPGGPNTAHQIVNTSDKELKYLAVSTMEMPEVCDYPDSQKFAVLALNKTNADGTRDLFRFVGKEDQSLGYWDGEGE